MNEFTNQFKDYDIKIHGVRVPKFNTNHQESNYDYLKQIAWKGFTEKGLDKKEDKYLNRLKYELEILRELDFVDYILMVWDVINYCKEEDIPIGPSRGSAAGCLTLYCIGVTEIDSIKYELIFERFISKTRAKKQIIDGVVYLDGKLMCDIDLDIDYYQRDKVFKYLDNKYKNKTAKISTFTTLSGKLLIKECGKIVGSKSESEMNDVSNLIPRLFGKVRDIQECYEDEESDNKFKIWCDKNIEVYNTALKLRNLIKNKGVHASALAVSYFPIEEVSSLELNKEGDLVTSCDMDQILRQMVKLDLLGLRTVSVVDRCCKLIGINRSEINPEDNFIYQQLQDLKAPKGLFQIEADTAYRTIRKIKPKNLNDLSAVMAIARPGALQFVDQYAKFCETGEAQSIHLKLDNILEKTGGLCLYQESLMKIGSDIFGLSLEEAEIMRRGVGKKNHEIISKFEQLLKNKTLEKGLGNELYEIYWKILKDSADYSFNFSHSISYSVLCAITVYLKFKYPREFYLSLLQMTKFEGDPLQEITSIYRELKQFGIELLPPDINKSETNFSIEDSNIRFGLGNIKGISGAAINSLENFNLKQCDKFGVFDAAKECGLNIGVLCALIQSGALINCENIESRTKTVFDAQLYNILTDREKRVIKELSLTKKTDKEKYHIGNLVNELAKTKDVKSKKDNFIIKESRYKTIRKKCAKFIEIYNQNKKYKEFTNWYFETILLGYSPKYSIKEIFDKRFDDLITLQDVIELECDENNKPKVKFVGIIDEIFSSKSKKGRKYLRVKCYDETSEVTALMFGGEGYDGFDKIETCKTQNNGLPKDGNIVIIEGQKKSEDTIYANSIVVQDTQIYTKLSDIKRSARIKKEVEES